MKLIALILLFAIVGKISATPIRYPLRLAYYRAAPAQQNQELVEDDADVEDDDDDVSDEVNFSNNMVQEDDDEDSEEQEEPPQFNKLFPLPQSNSPGYNYPLTSMMGEIQTQAWKVPKHPQNQQQQEREARDAIRISRDDDDDDSDEDEEEDEEEDDEPEDDLPNWQKLFPNLEAEANAGPPAGVVDTSTQPELPASFRSGLGGSRLVYVPARSFRQYQRRPVPSPQTVSRQYVLRNPTPPRSNVMYAVASPNYNNYNRRQQPVIQRRPQQIMYASSGPVRRQQQPYVMYMPMPVRRNSYNPYVSPYVPRYRYY